MNQDKRRPIESERELAGRLATQTGWTIRWHLECTSTMDVAHRLLNRNPSRAPTLILSDTQSSGRGRQGRRWESPSGGFFGTYILPTEKPVSRLAGFSLAAGVVFAEQLHTAGFPLFLKWPNDLLSANGAKVGGMLAEAVTEKSLNYLLLGIGINLKDVPRLDREVGALAEVGTRAASVADVAAWCSDPLVEAFDIFLEHGFTAFRERWVTKAMYLGKTLRIDTGDRVITGQFSGVTSQGCLALETASGPCEIISGHLLEVLF